MNASLSGLRPPRHHVDPRCQRWWTAQVALVMAAPLVVAVVLGLVLPWVFLIAAAWAVLTVVSLVAVPRVRWAIHR